MKTIVTWSAETYSTGTGLFETVTETRQYEGEFDLGAAMAAYKNEK